MAHWRMPTASRPQAMPAPAATICVCVCWTSDHTVPMVLSLVASLVVAGLPHCTVVELQIPTFSLEAKSVHSVFLINANHCCDKDALGHLRLFIGHDNNID
ncbi:hypothetical protein LAZ67_14002562 [Cordylochernes scorpioides]|uniref:Secreted protein n=1 Tax=Cordylochernes scorpioides TaxID=51811 RepID=A0ABY6LB52_9ARAC|nr:hypothetical protein LAZ67_14002562 [Cordylochernes scorpioides]